MYLNCVVEYTITLMLNILYFYRAIPCKPILVDRKSARLRSKTWRSRLAHHRASPHSSRLSRTLRTRRRPSPPRRYSHPSPSLPRGYRTLAPISIRASSSPARRAQADFLATSPTNISRRDRSFRRSGPTAGRD